MSSAAPTTRRKAALATFFGSTATTVVASIQALVLIPLYLTLIGPSLYGAWLATGELLALMLVFDMGIPNLMIQRIGASLSSGDKRAIGAYFGTGAAVLIVFAAILGIGLFAISSFVPGWMHLGGAEARSLSQALSLGVFATCAMLLTYLFQGLARGLQDTVLVNAGAFLGTVAGFAATTILLLQGYGLWSIAAGLVVRSGIALVGGIFFLVVRVDPEIRRSIRVDRVTAHEVWKYSPPLFLSSLGYTAMTNSQVFLTALVLGPQAAAVFGITRKAAEMAFMVLNAIGYASYGAFANLFAAGDRQRSRKVYDEVIAIYLGVGMALMCAYVAVNPSLVTVWAGASMYGGPVLTAIIALSTLIAGWSYLALSLYRSMDRHREVSNAILTECAARLGLMLGLGWTFGLPGFAGAAIVTGLISGLWAHRRIQKTLCEAEISRPKQAKTWLLRTSLFGAGLSLCLFGGTPTWGFVLCAGASIVALSGLIFLYQDPLLARVRQSLNHKLAGARG